MHVARDSWRLVSLVAAFGAHDAPVRPRPRQGIAKRGHYGAFLLEEVELLVSIVSTLAKGLRVPVTCKIRLRSSMEATMELCHALVGAGCSLLTVHGRTKEQNKQLVGRCDWGAIAAIKRALPIPVIANGGVADLADVRRCLAETGVDGVMSSEALLENPALFADNVHPQTGREVTQVGPRGCAGVRCHARELMDNEAHEPWHPAPALLMAACGPV